jgi:hypothetical protein
MIINRVEIHQTELHAELAATVIAEAVELPYRLHFRFPHAYTRHLRRRADPFLAALLLPAMALGEELHLNDPVSPMLLDGAHRIMEIFLTWAPDEFQPIHINAAARKHRRRWLPARRAGLFFTLGVDSFYSLLKARDPRNPFDPPITHLIYVDGFDVRSDNHALQRIVHDNLKLAAFETNTKLIFVASNLRGFTDPILRWGRCYGGGMAAVALALQQYLGTIYLSATFSYRDLIPLGSHPLIDPCWSTENLQFIHDGAERTRPERVLAIADDPLVRRTLRVCWENRNNRYNCGECEKCTRTMIALHAAGALGKVKTFPETINFSGLDLPQKTLSLPGMKAHYGDLLDVLGDDELSRDARARIEEKLAQGGW